MDARLSHIWIIRKCLNVNELLRYQCQRNLSDHLHLTAKRMDLRLVFKIYNGKFEHREHFDLLQVYIA